MAAEKQSGGQESGGDVNEESVEVAPADADQAFRIELKPGGNRLVIKLKAPEYLFSS